MIDYNVYLGPYFECEYTFVPGQKIKWACGNERCIKHDLIIGNEDASFCPVCGKLLIKSVEVFERPNVDPWDMVEEINEALMPVSLEYIELDDPFHIWIPNIKRKEPRRFHYNPITDYCAESLGRANFHLNEVVWLAEVFIEEFKVLKKYYKECLGQWGLIIYPS